MLTSKNHNVCGARIARSSGDANCKLIIRADTQVSSMLAPSVNPCRPRLTWRNDRSPLAGLGHWNPRRLLRPSAAAWRSSPTSATSGSPSPNPAPKQPDRPATATRQKLAAKRQPGNAPRAQGSTLGSLALPPDAAISGKAAGWRAPLTADDDYSHRHCRQPYAIGMACGKTRRSRNIRSRAAASSCGSAAQNSRLWSLNWRRAFPPVERRVPTARPSRRSSV